MIDPLRQQQLDELEEVEICHDILTNSRNELYLNFRYLDVALSSLGFLADRAGRGVTTDGFLIYYQPEHLMSMYKRGRVLIPLPAGPYGYAGKTGGPVLDSGL